MYYVNVTKYVNEMIQIIPPESVSQDSEMQSIMEASDLMSDIQSVDIKPTSNKRQLKADQKAEGNKKGMVVELNYMLMNSIDDVVTSPNSSLCIKEPKSRKMYAHSIIFSNSKASIKNEEKLRKEKIKEQNKERAQKSRNRKNRYAQDLEDKVTALEKQVKYLTLELDKYKKRWLREQVGKEEIEDQNIAEDQNILKGILDKLSTDPLGSNFIQDHTEVCKKEGSQGKNRLKTLDNALDVIVDFMIPDTLWASFYIMHQDGNSEVFINEKVNKKLKNYSKYQIQEALDNQEINDWDLYWHELAPTKEQIEKINEHHGIISSGKHKCREIFVKLNELRNEIQDNGKLLAEYPLKVIPVLERKQLVSCKPDSP